MLKKHPLVLGTCILTLTGLFSRIIGFFYRIFLSQKIGAEGMGIYQLIAPAMALTFSLCSAGIQTSISKFVANEPASHDYKSSRSFLLVGFSLSLLLSSISTIFIYQNASFIATNILLEKRCEPLLRIFSLSIPFASAHSCINGYYYGIKHTAIPSASQLIEQLVRVGSVYAICSYYDAHHLPIRISICVIGLLLGEITSCAVSIIAVSYRFYHLNTIILFEKIQNFKTYCKNLISIAFPLSLNRIVINILQSVEAIYIPNRLMLYGLNNETVLSIYGVLTGMAIPLILFPTALTGSVSVLLLPYVAQSQEQQDKIKLTQAFKKSLSFTLFIGFCCTLFFFLFGKFLGEFLFHNTLAGTFIMSMSFLCPFLYSGSILSSIMHGLGKAGTAFIHNCISMIVRLLFVFYAIPQFGITGYLWGLLLSEITLCTLYIMKLSSYIKVSYK